jgi:small subunit ribosomal protein S17
MADENEKQENEETPEVVAAKEVAPEAEVATTEEVAEAEEVAEEVAPEAEEEVPEPVAEAELAPEAPAETEEEAATEDAAAEEPAAETVAAAEAEQAAAAPGRKKKKRLPRALRRQRPKLVHEKPKERRPIVRLPKPEPHRGRSQERQGTVVSAAMDKTIVVRVDTVKVHPRYKKVIRRSSKFHAHDEQNEAKVGDVVLIVETRPLSRTKRWRLQKVVQAAR